MLKIRICFLDLDRQALVRLSGSDRMNTDPDPLHWDGNSRCLYFCSAWPWRTIRRARRRSCSSALNRRRTRPTSQTRLAAFFLSFLTGNVLLKKGLSLHRSVADPLSLNNGSGRIWILAGHVCGPCGYWKKIRQIDILPLKLVKIWAFWYFLIFDK